MNTEQKKGARSILKTLNQMLDAEEAEIPLRGENWPPHGYIPIGDFRRWLKNLEEDLKKKEGRAK